MSRGEDDELRVAADATELPVEKGDTEFPDFTDDETAPTLRGMWMDADSSEIAVRGATYMEDQIKVEAGPAVGRLLHFDVWTTATPEARHHITRFDLARAGDDSVVRFCQQHHPDALVFVLNIELPDANNVSLVSYWLVPKYYSKEEHEENDDRATFYRLLRRFIDSDDDAFRDARFKMIPAFTQAPWIINQLVQARPALTGKKLTQRYFKGDNYLEVAMDISSSTIAHYIGSLCQSWSTYIEVDVFVTVQGESEDELPEKILGAVRIQYVDLGLGRRIDGDEHDDVQEDSE